MECMAKAIDGSGAVDQAKMHACNGKVARQGCVSPLQRFNLDHAKRFRVRKCKRGSDTCEERPEPHTPGGTIMHGGLAVSPGKPRSLLSCVFGRDFEITEMCKNVDDCIKSDCGDMRLCRDPRNPVGVTVCRVRRGVDRDSVIAL